MYFKSCSEDHRTQWRSKEERMAKSTAEVKKDLFGHEFDLIEGLVEALGLDHLTHTHLLALSYCPTYFSFSSASTNSCQHVGWLLLPPNLC
jgi:hypothetical protein